MRLLVILDALDKLDLAGDTSYALMLEAARREHEIWTCEVGDLGLEHDAPVACAQPTQVRAAQTPAEAFACEPATYIPLDAFDVVMMRKDPPVDMNYLQATWLLERARGRTVLVNDPRGLRELNEHLAILDFPELIPPTLVTRSPARLRRFLDEQGGTIVVKPVEGFGGLGIFMVKDGDPNTSSILETATRSGTQWTMAQRYLPAAVQGDKRILLVDGEPIGAVLRVPPANEARGNLHVGGRAVKTEIDERDREIIAALAPMLASYGQIFVGIDVIGGMLTEINITSPTGIRHIDTLENRNSSAPVLDCLERKAAALR
ncbi:glutathione synthase [Haliangium ochraceum]|uniref:Glutathione synthetase n=1 Tax=Haliangium ochraceum (strain DSM 14365 / JCM 11303 / SMP-2) TaxID=502025 RepID=D0LFQ7_HALO1|nr:glutathione synthase [Haliangium ochraceum]ACY12691.1 glutathione synthetase [Haliangium ochraceum DSM 14365]